MKRITIHSMLLAMLLFLLPANSFAQFTRVVGGIQYTFYPSVGSAVVTGYTNDIPEEVTIPKSITINENSSYDGVWPVTQIYGSGTDGGAFKNCTKIKTINLDLRFIHIADDVFHGCTNLTTVNWEEPPASWDYIGNSTVVNLDGPTTLSDAQSGYYIGHYSFGRCTSLKKITIPHTIAMIDKAAFANCTNLEEINLPDSLIFFNYYDVFSNCPSLRHVYSHIKNPWGKLLYQTSTYYKDYPLSGFAEDCTLHVPKGHRQAYARSYLWSNFRFIVEDEADVKTIKALSELSNGKVYKLQPEQALRGIIFTRDDAEYLDACGGNIEHNNFDVEIKDDDPNQQFAIYNYNGKFYLYSVGQRKFVSQYETVGTNVFFKLSEQPGMEVELMPSSVEGEYVFVVGGEAWINVTSREYGCVGSWKQEDGGNRISIIEVGDMSKEISQLISNALDVYTSNPKLTISEGENSYYNVQGQRLPKPKEGINIVRNKDGISRKVLVK